jgi:hypothetical protein
MHATQHPHVLIRFCQCGVDMQRWTMSQPNTRLPDSCAPGPGTYNY